MINRFLIIFCLVLISNFLSYEINAQVDWNNPNKISKNIVLKDARIKIDSINSKKIAINLRYINNGIGFGLRTENTLDFFLKNVHLSFSEYYHPKEEKIIQDNSNIFSDYIRKPFKYGKISNFYYVSLGLGGVKRIFENIMKDVSLDILYNIGYSQGIVKPYFLNVLQNDSEERISYNDNPELFLSRNKIIGKSEWKYGLNEIKFIPGFNLDFNIYLSKGNDSHIINSLFIGASLVCFSNSFYVLANQNQLNFLQNFYIGYELSISHKILTKRILN